MPWYLLLGVGALAAVAAAILGVYLLHRLIRRLGRRVRVLASLARRGYRPAQVLAVLFALQLSLLLGAPGGGWREPVLHGLGLALIGAGAWLVIALVLVFEDASLARIRLDRADNRQARRMHTQITLIRRVAVAVIAVLTIGAMLMTFPGARAAGTSLLASAGVIGAISALAAQSLLGNVFAGVQIAFSDAIRIEDVVVVEQEWGRIEDITLTYVVVHLWDDRRLILPTSYFMAKPFENWTRRESRLLGTVELDVDFAVPVEAMRAELRRALEASELWDGRVCVLQVTQAINTLLRVRALVSAADAGSLWDLRCLVREDLARWLREQHADALPRLRVEQARPGGGRDEPAPADDADARLFGDTADGRERTHAFSGPAGNPAEN
ncbi:mechanosensitive ion channel family protein [Crossiella cryophila]|uniref:Small-conductance mechanosensitive channel n=1 Tax=Crossiella cryophila TaxID=43355 RepID=A0A7W7FTA4_9PSEU|nr:mechanosensitive ion channel domain-containing protein [Crossiella cryophila]MBB4677946.1 small-conductance mechanosensitive channel [Crossiella cryophila]